MKMWNAAQIDVLEINETQSGIVGTDFEFLPVFEESSMRTCVQRAGTPSTTSNVQDNETSSEDTTVTDELS